VTGLNVQRHRWTFEFLSIALSLLIPVEVRFKHALGCHRPVEFSPQVQPIITTPGHGTFPMGHAAQAFMLAYVVEKLFNLRAPDPRIKQLQRQAARISINRVIAGVHFPVDAIVGRALGQTMGEFFLRRCGQKNQPVVSRTFAAAAFVDTQADKLDFSSEALSETLKAEESQTYAVEAASPIQLNELLNAFRKLAVNECREPKLPDDRA
jgi:hypothetical protein